MSGGPTGPEHAAPSAPGTGGLVPGTLDVVVLAGGSGRRLGGRSKADLVLGGGRLLDRALDATVGARARVVVGDVAVPGDVVLARERPPGSGPAAGLLAGLSALPPGAAPTVLVLACDLVHPARAIDLLSAATLPAGRDGACLVDADGRRQWLAGRYRRTALDAAAARLVEAEGRSLRELLGPLDLVEVSAPAATVADVDTWADHRYWSTHPEREDDDG